METGTILEGRFEIGDILGSGAFADVYAAVDNETGVDVAVKYLRRPRANDRTAAQRLDREGADLDTLSDIPNVAHLIASGERDGHPYLVIDVVVGRDLQDVLEKDGALAIERAVEIMIAICDTLDGAHKAGIVHRDVKPANIVVSADGRPYLMDFGIAISERDTERLTTHTMILGTGAFAPPEQLKGDDVDATADVYAAGATLYSLLTGRPPFIAADIATVATMKQRRRAPRASRLRGDVSIGLDAVVGKALERSPQKRYPSAAEMRDDLERVARGDSPANVKSRFADNFKARVVRANDFLRTRDPMPLPLLRIARFIVIWVVPSVIMSAVWGQRAALIAAVSAISVAIADFRGTRLGITIKSFGLLVGLLAFGQAWHTAIGANVAAELNFIGIATAVIALFAIYTVGVDRRWARIPILLLVLFLEMGAVQAGRDVEVLNFGKSVLSVVIGFGFALVLILMWRTGLGFLGIRARGPMRKYSVSSLVAMSKTGYRAAILASLRWDPEQQMATGAVESRFIRAVAGLGNAAGGTIIVGVDQEGAAVGIDHDLDATSTVGGVEMLKYWTRGLLRSAISEEASHAVAISFPSFEHKAVLRVDVAPSQEPLLARTRTDGEVFCLHTEGATRILGPGEMLRYVESRWD